VHGDIIDEMIASYINSMDITLPIARISEGQYLFGTKKINAKVINGNKLLVRVGGGYTEFKEFISTYQQAE